MNLPHLPKLIVRRRQENMGRSRAPHVLMSVLLLHRVFLQMPLASPLPDQIHLNHPKAHAGPLSLCFTASFTHIHFSVFLLHTFPVTFPPLNV